jgi:hypothetical protein
MGTHIENAIADLQGQILDTMILRDELEDKLRVLESFKSRTFIAVKELPNIFSVGDRFVETWHGYIQRENHQEGDGGLSLSIFEKEGRGEYLMEITDEH